MTDRYPWSTNFMDDLDPIRRDDLLEHVRRSLPSPVREEAGIDGSTILIGGDPGEVVVRVTASKVSVSVFRVHWDGPHTPRIGPRQLATLSCSRLPAVRTMMALHTLIIAASEVRRASYRKCERFGETKPPEWMHDRRTCQSCAERELGVVH
jgi:hypothetical protein